MESAKKKRQKKMKNILKNAKGRGIVGSKKKTMNAYDTRKAVEKLVK